MRHYARPLPEPRREEHGARWRADGGAAVEVGKCHRAPRRREFVYERRVAGAGAPLRVVIPDVAEAGVVKHHQKNVRKGRRERQSDHGDHHQR